jgi:hypothetical protein
MSERCCGQGVVGTIDTGIGSSCFPVTPIPWHPTAWTLGAEDVDGRSVSTHPRNTAAPPVWLLSVCNNVGSVLGSVVVARLCAVLALVAGEVCSMRALIRDLCLVQFNFKTAGDRVIHTGNFTYENEDRHLYD